jgi:hypothetical protein
METIRLFETLVSIYQTSRSQSQKAAIFKFSSVRASNLILFIQPFPVVVEEPDNNELLRISSTEMGKLRLKMNPNPLQYRKVLDGELRQ